jgi:hypothetical protein
LYVKLGERREMGSKQIARTIAPRLLIGRISRIPTRGRRMWGDLEEGRKRESVGKAEGFGGSREVRRGEDQIPDFVSEGAFPRSD